MSEKDDGLLKFPYGDVPILVLEGRDLTGWELVLRVKEEEAVPLKVIDAENGQVALDLSKLKPGPFEIWADIGGGQFRVLEGIVGDKKSRPRGGSEG